jgi:hypothetical protein
VEVRLLRLLDFCGKSTSARRRLRGVCACAEAPVSAAPAGNAQKTAMSRAKNQAKADGANKGAAGTHRSKPYVHAARLDRRAAAC